MNPQEKVIISRERGKDWVKRGKEWIKEKFMDKGNIYVNAVVDKLMKVKENCIKSQKKMYVW